MWLWAAGRVRKRVCPSALLCCVTCELNLLLCCSCVFLHAHASLAVAGPRVLVRRSACAARGEHLPCTLCILLHCVILCMAAGHAIPGVGRCREVGVLQGVRVPERLREADLRPHHPRREDDGEHGVFVCTGWSSCPSPFARLYLCFALSSSCNPIFSRLSSFL